VSFVNDPSGFRSVVISIFFLFFPAASLYDAFQGLASAVKLQYSFHDLVFSLFIVAAYFDFWSRYVCMYVCMYYVCMYVICMYVYMYVCMYVETPQSNPEQGEL
jgi:hypothetical protein